MKGSGLESSHFRKCDDSRPEPDEGDHAQTSSPHSLDLLSLAAPILAAPAASSPRDTAGVSVAERLGHPRDARLIVLHADDVGMARSVNKASFEALDERVVDFGHSRPLSLVPRGGELRARASRRRPRPAPRPRQRVDHLPLGPGEPADQAASLWTSRALFRCSSQTWRPRPGRRSGARATGADRTRASSSASAPPPGQPHGGALQHARALPVYRKLGGSSACRFYRTPRSPASRSSRHLSTRSSSTASCPRAGGALSRNGERPTRSCSSRFRPGSTSSSYTWPTTTRRCGGDRRPPRLGRRVAPGRPRPVALGRVQAIPRIRRASSGSRGASWPGRCPMTIAKGDEGEVRIQAPAIGETMPRHSVLVLTFVALTATGAAAAPPGTIVLTNANVVDVRAATVRPGMTLVLRDGRSSRSAPPRAGGAQDLDARGRYVLPGLVDAHTHISTFAAARQALESGVTTVRSSGVLVLLRRGLPRAGQEGRPPRSRHGRARLPRSPPRGRRGLRQPSRALRAHGRHRHRRRDPGHGPSQPGRGCRMDQSPCHRARGHRRHRPAQAGLHRGRATGPRSRRPRPAESPFRPTRTARRGRSLPSEPACAASSTGPTSPTRRSPS